MIRVLVVDDHPVVRQGLVAVLDDEVDLEVVGSAGSAEEAIVLAEREQPDVLLLDLELPGMDGVAAVPHIARVSPRTRVLVFTAYDADERVLGAVRAGAKGYLLKGAPAEEIARAVRTVSGGGAYLQGSAATTVLTAMSGARVARKAGGVIRAERARRPGAAGQLSEREREVLRLVARGLPTKQIAQALHITERTVKFHVRSIFNKLDADTRAQAVAQAVERHLL